MMVFDMSLFGTVWEKLPRSYFEKGVGTELFQGHDAIVEYIAEKFDEYLRNDYGFLAVYRRGCEVIGPTMTVSLWSALRRDYPVAYAAVTSGAFSFWREFVADYGSDFESDAIAHKKLKEMAQKQGETE